MPTPNANLRIEGWQELAEVFGILRGGEVSESTPSVVLKTTASNAVQVEVKVYNRDADKARDDAVRIFDEVRSRYGLA